MAVAIPCPNRAEAAGFSQVRAGVAQEPFLFESRVPLAGYSRRHGVPSQGVHDMVGVRALVIEDADTTVALVSCDLLVIDEQLFAAVRDRLLAQALPPQTTLILAATHTHSGPGAYGRKFAEKISMGHFDPQVFETLVRTIVKTVILAHEHLVTVRVAYETERTEGLIKNRVEAEGLTDPDLVVAAFYSVSGRQPMAIIVNFSAHPTALGAWNKYLSADYPGVVTRHIESRYPGSVCLFFAGSVGDQAPVKAGIGFERAEWIGQTLAQDVERLLEKAHPEEASAVDELQEQLPLPPAKVRFNVRFGLPHWISRRLVDDDATLSLVTVGTIAFLGVPCDLASDLGADLKQAASARGFHSVIVGFADDYIGYCVTEQRYHTAEYEALMAFNGPKTGKMVVEHLIRMLETLGHGAGGVGQGTGSQ